MKKRFSSWILNREHDKVKINLETDNYNVVYQGRTKDL